MSTMNPQHADQTPYVEAYFEGKHFLYLAEIGAIAEPGEYIDRVTDRPSRCTHPMARVESSERHPGVLVQVCEDCGEVVR